MGKFKDNITEKFKFDNIKFDDSTAKPETVKKLIKDLSITDNEIQRLDLYENMGNRNIEITIKPSNVLFFNQWGISSLLKSYNNLTLTFSKTGNLTIKITEK